MLTLCFTNTLFIFPVSLKYAHFILLTVRFEIIKRENSKTKIHYEALLKIVISIAFETTISILWLLFIIFDYIVHFEFRYITLCIEIQI